MNRILPYCRPASIFKSIRSTYQPRIERCSSSNAKPKVIYEQAAKQIYVGRVPISMFEYPELDTKEEVTAITRSVRQFEELVFPNLRHEVTSILPANYVETRRQAVLNVDDMQNSVIDALSTQRIRDKRTYLARRCEALGLLEFSNLRMKRESFYELLHRMLIANVVNLAGNDEAKARVGGALLAATRKRAYYCVREASCSLHDAASLRTTLSVSVGGKAGEQRYILNGVKPIYVPRRSQSGREKAKSAQQEGETALFLVLANRVDKSSTSDRDNLVLLAFERPVMRTSAGERPPQSQREPNTVLIEQDASGERAVHFENLTISEHEQLRPDNDGDVLRLVTQAENAARMPIATFSIGLLKAALNGLIVAASANKHVTFVNGEPLADSEALRSVALHAAVHLYAAESAVYFTAAQQDRFGDAPLFYEAACCQLLVSDALRFFADALGSRLQLHLPATIAESPSCRQVTAEELFQAARFSSFLDGGVEQLGSFVAQEGLLFAVRIARRDVSQRRNSLHAPLYVLRSLLGRARPRAAFDLAALPLNADAEEHSPGVLRSRKLNLAWYLHPTLHSSAAKFESDLSELGERSVDVLGHSGDALQQRTATLSRFATCATWLFGAACALSRSSRSLCVGLVNAEHERSLTEVLVAEHSGARLRAHADSMRSVASGAISDAVVRRETDKMFRLRQYAADHPLMRTW